MKGGTLGASGLPCHIGNVNCPSPSVMAAPWRTLRAFRAVQWRGIRRHHHAFQLKVMEDHRARHSRPSKLSSVVGF